MTASNPASVLTLRRTTRQFGARVALLDVTVELQPGLVGLLGPNGAGKTTLLRLAAGLLAPSSGDVRWFDGLQRHDPRLDNRIAYVPDGELLPPRDSPLEFCTVLLRAAGLNAHEAEARAKSVLGRLGLDSQRDTPMGKLSRGQRQRVKLAQAFALPAMLVLLDEPLNALDPVWRLEAAALMHEAVAAGACVVLSSHILEEVESLTSWLVLLFRGRLVAAGTLREIHELLHNRANALRIQCSDPRSLGRELLGRAPVGLLRFQGDEVTVQAPDIAAIYRALPSAVVASGVRVTQVVTDGDDLVGLFKTLSGEVR
jgi:ABC-2 type transport system ATP-binding protein